MKRCIVLLSVALSCLHAADTRLPLGSGWYIQPSTDAVQDEVLANTPFDPRHSYRASVPSTVMAALVADHVYPDPTFGMNLRTIPGATYPIGENFSNIPMPPGSAFRSSWWYRTQFTAPADYAGKRIQLHFDGINFRANVWLNGRQIASADKMAGAWRLFEFDVTGIVIPGKPNALAVEVFPPTPDDLAITFVDWNPAPPDKGMGIWRDVYLTGSGPVTIRFPQVITKLDLPAVDKAHLTVTAELHNQTDGPVEGILKGRIADIEFSQSVTLEKSETKVVTFAPDKFAQLNLLNPRLWWPAQVGPQNLYGLKLEFETASAVSDRSEMRFGIREVTSELETASVGSPAQIHRIFSVNGRRILIRGGGWTFDMLLRASPQRQEDELRYVRDLNLNAVRMEGKIENDNFLRLADEYGILVLAGWCCCDHWERWQDWDDEDRRVAAASLRDQIRRLRSHPSAFNWMNGSDNPPPPEIEKMYIGILEELNWPNPYESSATARPTTVTGATGVKMTGPYEYVAPSYWLLDQARGGAHGFNTETSPGPAIPPMDSLRRMLPEDHLWPIDSWWDYHAGGGVFKDLAVFRTALNQRYGPSTSLEEFATKAQVMSYEGERAMFEAFGRNKYRATGVIQWMLNNAWPSMIWHLYDYYLRPGGSYFGAKKACEPLHIQYSYDDHSIAVVNSFYQDFQSLRATAKIYNLDLSEKYSHEAAFDIPADGVRTLFAIPQIQGLSPAYFVKLTLADAAGKVVSSNFYWLSTKEDVLDWENSTWYRTPTKAFSDLTALNSLPRVELRIAATNGTAGADRTTHVTIENPTSHLAFSVHLKLANAPRDPGAPADEMLPVLWQDNYFALLPGEKREIAATSRISDAGPGPKLLEVDGWNVAPESVPVQ
ncbi:MAG: sugar-binding domain-containing protein [Bryobacteraceae bacterium]|jgi:exo-1,4-beta-D-glucosaminidase